MAPRNKYEQLYLEDFGTGSLRVSMIARGDPVIVGDMFVHQKLSFHVSLLFVNARV